MEEWHKIEAADQDRSGLDESLLKKALEASHDEIYICDAFGRTVYCNQQFEANYGISREEIMGKTAMYLVEQGYADVTPVPLVMERKTVITMDQKTQTGRSLIITASPVFNSQGEMVYIIENCRDITELQKTRLSLEEKEKELERYKNRVKSFSGDESWQQAENFSAWSFRSPAMGRVVERVERVAPTDASILLLGESGTGKSRLAALIHSRSARREGPFITLNCSTVAPTLIESELFGYAAGAFTGASQKGKRGLVDLADGGTLFLDEIGEIPQALQTKFLQLLQEKSFTPVGGTRPRQVDIRILAATHQDLQKQVAEKHFREDLYYRLKVVEIEVPALRERREDIPILLDHFVRQYNGIYKRHRWYADAVLDKMQAYDWPGNIRELQNLVHSLVIMALEEEITLADLPGQMLMNVATEERSPVASGSFDAMMEAYERMIIQKHAKSVGSTYKLAKLLGISQTKASRLSRKYRD